MVVRIYSGSDADMIQTAKTLYSSFTEDIADFTNYDPDYNDTFSQNWLSQIEAADNVQKEDSVEDVLTGLTNKVNECMKECQNKFVMAKHFIEKAFPDNTAVHNEFGYNDFAKDRKSQPKMIQFMRNYDRVANKYSEQLIAKNYTAENIAEIKTLADNLDAANSEQESYKKNRSVLSQDRITVLNTCRKTCVQIADTGKLIYAENPAKHKKYVLTVTSSGGTTEQPPVEGNAS